MMQMQEAEIDSPEGEAEVGQATGEQILYAIMQMPNIAESLKQADSERVAEIGQQVIEDYEIDDASREEWLAKNEDALKLAMMVAEEKNYPFANAANIKYPLLSTAALQFNARSYSAIVAPDRVVKCKVRGRDPNGEKAARSERVSEFMSDQLLHEQPEWEEDTDRMLVMLPIVGSVFRKVWYDSALQRNVSRLIPPEDMVVNYRASSIHTVPRITEILRLYPYEIEERIRDGRFLEFNYKETAPQDGEEEAEKTGETATGDDDSAPHTFLEQHCLLDLDEDGYPEPYVVTVHRDTSQVVRIVANFNEDTVTIAQNGDILSIRRHDYFVHYQFLPNPDGGFYGLGFGWLLSSTNETINTTLNQLLDAGHRANMQGGLISSVLGVREKSIRLEQGEWRVIQTNGPLKDAIMPIKYGEPSSVLFNLLGLMIDMGKELASVKDVLSGEGQGKNASPTTTMALIEQGLQVFTSIYKRIHRTLKHEFSIQARLNTQYVTPERYAQFFDEPAEQQQAPQMPMQQGSPEMMGQMQPAAMQIDPQADFNSKDFDILPVSDPQSVTKMQKLAKAQLVLQTSQGNPLVNQQVALKRFYEAADIENADELITDPPQPSPEEQAFMEAMRDLELQEKVSQIKENLASALKDVASAEGEEEGRQLDQYKLVLDSLHQLQGMMQGNPDEQAGQGRVPGMVSPANDPSGIEALQQQGGFGDGTMPGTSSL